MPTEPIVGRLGSPSGGTGASQVLPFSLLRCYVCMGCRVIVFCTRQRLATRCVSWRIDLIDSVSRSLWLFLGVPTRSRLRSFLSRSSRKGLKKCVSALVRLLAGSRCLVKCIAHPGSVVSAHKSRPCSSRLHRSSALRTLHLPACPVPESLFLLPH